MKRGTIVALAIAGVLVVGVGGAAAVSLSGGGDPAAVETASSADEAVQSSAEPTEEPGASEEPDADQASGGVADDQADDASATPAGSYVEYSEDALAAAEGTRVLFFHATWCPQCRALDEDIVAAGVPDGITVLKVDYDTHQDLRQAYDVRQQTTVVALDDSGAAVASFVPYDDPSLDTALAGLGLG
ncbi:thioredoxin family protein [Microbacterium xanthum]|uniref:thioredoxin family protein n=1 Tax=Microbacterium xanthum TaxID=3079794 RepID=UPI002AD42C08|nr:thioredoxin family protein [Microbacterium sp. KSW-48]MDZ8171420.1 thioredoxin family protein [Microbacterium sp. KSW-48]